MYRILSLIFILLLALVLPSQPTVDLFANTTSVAPGGSVNYTIEAHADRTASVYFDAPAGMVIWSVSAPGADGCVQPSETRAQCVGLSSLMFVSARASSSPRCADYTAHVRADDHVSAPADTWLTLPRAEPSCTLALPLLGDGTIPQSPYPGP